MVLLSPRRLEVLALAEGLVRNHVHASLAPVARRITVVAEAQALLLCVWQHTPEVIILQGLARPPDVPALCRQIRRFFQTPILVIEEGASERERISWLDSGADDVLALTTAAPAELSARCYALQRRLRRQLQRDPEALRMQALGMQLDIAERRLYLAHGQPVDLSASTTRLLGLFFDYGESLVATADLDQHLFGASTPTTQKRTAALILSFNRQMARLPGPHPRVERVWNSGYRLTFSGPAPAAPGPAAQTPIAPAG